MAEYIEREAAIELLQGPITMSMCLTTDECQNKRDQRIIDLALIKSIPAADVVPVRHGKWNYEEKELRHNVIACFHTCSFCGYHTNLFVIKTISTSPYYYCPNCGAKMEVEE